MKILKLNHSTYRHAYHIVGGTKYRRKYLKSYVKEYLSILIEKFQRKYPTLEIIAWNIDEDHIHLQMIIPPNVTVSDTVKRFKTYTSQKLRKQFSFIHQMYLEKDGIWSVGYFSSTNRLNDLHIQKYIENQGEKDIPEQQSFLEEDESTRKL